MVRRPLFATVEGARTWVERFVRWHNDERLRSGINFVTPAQRHRGVDAAVLAARDAVYERASPSASTSKGLKIG